MRRRFAQRGFSLLEVLVAFTILSLSLGLLMQIFSGSLRNADVTRKQAQAASLAQSLLAEIGVETPLAEGVTSGTVDSIFRWQIGVTPFQEPLPSGQMEMITPPAMIELWKVDVRVAWGEETGPSERSVDLVTLRTQPIQPR
jgi:general secretion pathway protein I